MWHLFAVEDLFVAGLGFDIAGATILAWGLIVSPARIRVLSGTYYGLNVGELVRQARDRVDAVNGVTALVSGFTLQLVGYVLSLLIDQSEDHDTARALGALAVGALCLGLAFVIHFAIRRNRVWKLCLRISHHDGYGNSLDAPLVSIVHLFDGALGRRRGESFEQYVRQRVDHVTDDEATAIVP